MFKNPKKEVLPRATQSMTAPVMGRSQARHRAIHLTKRMAKRTSTQGITASMSSCVCSSRPFNFKRIVAGSET